MDKLVGGLDERRYSSLVAAGFASGAAGHLPHDGDPLLLPHPFYPVISPSLSSAPTIHIVLSISHRRQQSSPLPACHHLLPFIFSHPFPIISSNHPYPTLSLSFNQSSLRLPPIIFTLHCHHVKPSISYPHTLYQLEIT